MWRFHKQTHEQTEEPFGPISQRGDAGCVDDEVDVSVGVGVGARVGVGVSGVGVGLGVGLGVL